MYTVHIKRKRVECIAKRVGESDEEDQEAAPEFLKKQRINGEEGKTGVIEIVTKANASQKEQPLDKSASSFIKIKDNSDDADKIKPLIVINGKVIGNSKSIEELKIDTEDIKEGNVLGSLRDDDVMSRCVYPFNRIVVNPHGFVVACTADFHKKLEIGDTTKNTLTEIWNGEKFQYLRKKHLDKKLNDIFCNKCINNIECKTTDLNEAFEKNL